MAGKPHASRNKILAGGISLYSRSAMYKRKALHKKKKVQVKPTKAKRAYFKLKDIKGENNGTKRVVLLKKTPRFYPTEDVPRKLRSRKNPKPAKLRGSITPGTVLILLAGRHMGKRVVFLKQLESGLLLVTGPFAINGVPLRRVAQAYVIATKTKVDMSGVNLPDGLDDDLFRRTDPDRKADGTADIFADSKQGYTVSERRRGVQKEVDSKVLPVVKTVPNMRHYLGSRFSLRHGQYPHKMMF